jgi:hypothetical protein
LPASTDKMQKYILYNHRQNSARGRLQYVGSANCRMDSRRFSLITETLKSHQCCFSQQLSYKRERLTFLVKVWNKTYRYEFKLLECCWSNRTFPWWSAQNCETSSLNMDNIQTKCKRTNKQIETFKLCKKFQCSSLFDVYSSSACKSQN